MKTTILQLSSRNEAVEHAYYAMLKLARQQLSTIERHELRCTLIREDKPKQAGIIHEMVNPLLYLRLELHEDAQLAIRYGFEPAKEYAHITVAFTRSVYRLTMKENSKLNIEDAIKTDWYLHNPDEMYAYIEDNNKHHTFQLIKYRLSASRRKQMKAVA